MRTQLRYFVIVCAWAAIVSLGFAASPEFNRRYESALKVMRETDSRSKSTDPDYILIEFKKVLEAGSLQDISKAVALTMRDTSKRQDWQAAGTFATMLGPNFDYTEILAAIRENFASYFDVSVLKNPEALYPFEMDIAASLLCYHGTDEDVRRLQEFVDQVKPLSRSFTSGIEGRIVNRPRVLQSRQEANEQNDKQGNAPRSAQTDKTSVSPLKPKVPNAPVASPTAEPNATTPWIAWVIMITGLIGLLWLVIKKRK